MAAFGITAISVYETPMHNLGVKSKALKKYRMQFFCCYGKISVIIPFCETHVALKNIYIDHLFSYSFF